MAHRTEGYRPQYPGILSPPRTANVATAASAAPTDEKPNRSAWFRPTEETNNTAHHTLSAPTVCQVAPDQTATKPAEVAARLDTTSGTISNPCQYHFTLNSWRRLRLRIAATRTIARETPEAADVVHATMSISALDAKYCLAPRTTATATPRIARYTSDSARNRQTVVMTIAAREI